MTERDDLRTFIREILLRYDRGMATVRDEQRANREELRAQREENRVYFEELRAQGERESRRIDDLIAESRAQRQALLHVLDTLRGNGGTAPAG